MNPSDIVLALRHYGVPEMRQLFSALSAQEGLDAAGRSATTEEFKLLREAMQKALDIIIRDEQRRDLAARKRVGPDSILNYMPVHRYARAAANVVVESL